MPDIDVLERIQQRVLWLAVRMVDHANRERPHGEVKVGGHQASSASLVGVMTALWFAYLNGSDQVSVKPHASPVLHAINYLLGGLDRAYLTELRAFGGLQAYPSLTKDPDRPSTSPPAQSASDAAAPLFAAAPDAMSTPTSAPANEPGSSLSSATPNSTRGTSGKRSPTRPRPGLGNVMWIVDFNRQSLDRVIPGASAIGQWSRPVRRRRLARRRSQVRHRLQTAFAPAGRRGLRDWIDDMPNEQYQAVFGLTATAAAPTTPRRSPQPPSPAAPPPDLRRRRLRATSSPTSAATTSPALLDAYADRRRGARPPDRHLRLHHQGLEAALRRRRAQPLRADDPRPGSTALRSAARASTADDRWAPSPRRLRGGRAAPRRGHEPATATPEPAPCAACRPRRGIGRRAHGPRVTPRWRSATSSQTSPRPHPLRPAWSPPPRTWRCPPTWAAGSTRSASTTATRARSSTRRRAS